MNVEYIKKTKMYVFKTTCSSFDLQREYVDMFNEERPEKLFAFLVQCKKKDHEDVKKLYHGETYKALRGLKVLKHSCPKVYGGLDEAKMDKISKYGIRIDVHSDNDSESEHLDEESNIDHEETQRSAEEDEPKKNDPEQEWYKTVGCVKDDDIEDIDFDELDDEDIELLEKDPLNIRMIEDNQNPLRRIHNEDILRSLGLTEHQIQEQLELANELRKAKKKDDDSDKDDSELARDDIVRE